MCYNLKLYAKGVNALDNIEKDEQHFDMSQIEELQKSIQLAQEASENIEAQEAIENQEQSEVQNEAQSEAQSEAPANQTEEVIPDLAHWEEFSKENNVVKKYITYISKDFVDIMDKMSTDERSAYINDAIQKKIDIENEELQLEKKKATVTHIVLAVATLIISMPFVLIGVNKAIMHTFDNYKYSQDNFERLYKHRFEKEKAHIRTLQHNLLNKDVKNKK